MKLAFVGYGIREFGGNQGRRSGRLWRRLERERRRVETSGHQ